MILLLLCMRNWTWRTHGEPIVYGLHSHCVFSHNITYCISVLKVPSINEGELKIATV